PLIQRRDLSWSVRFIYDRTRSMITRLDIPEYFDGTNLQGTGTMFKIAAGERLGTFYGHKFLTSCSELPAPFNTDCGGAGASFQRNDEGWLVWVGAGNSWRDGITKNLWQTRLPASQSPWGYALAWGHPVVDRPLAGQPGQGVGINQIIGNVFPDYRFSISNDFSYKKFTLYALLDATIGNSINNQGEGWGLLSVSSAHFDQA